MDAPLVEGISSGTTSSNGFRLAPLDSPSYDVVIVGGGLSGCAMATALADGKRKILVLEARKGQNPRFNGELIHPQGVDVLEELGFLDALVAAGGAQLHGFACVPSKNTPATLLPYAEIPDSRARGFAIDHRVLVEQMRKIMATRPEIELRVGERVVDLLRADERVVGVVTQSGPVRARVVIACDGRHSKVRALIEMPERATLLSYMAAARLVGCPLPHASYGHIFLGAWGPILVYPIDAHDARTCIDLPLDMDKGKDAVRARVKSEYAPHLPDGVAATLHRALDEEELEIAANYAIYTDECVVPGVALVGDSAGCSHPLTATGMTIALFDVRALARELGRVDLSNGAAVDGALQSYQTARYRFVRAREILADALYEVFRGSDPGTRAIRDGIFRYWNASLQSRARSMALLSGHESRLPAFLREYLTVVRMSTSSALRGNSADGMFSSLYGLGKKSWEKFSMVARGVREGSLR